MSEPLSNTQLKHRLLGAGILVAIAVIVIPFFLGEPKYGGEEDAAGRTVSTAEFESKIQPLPGAVPEAAGGGVVQPRQAESGADAVLKKPSNQPPKTTMQNADAEQSAVIKPLDRSEVTTAPAKSGTKSVISPRTTAKNAPAPQPAPSKKTAKKAAPAPASTGKTLTSGWAVQAGVFGKSSNATDLAAVLKRSGYAPQVSDVTNRPGIKKRVWLGPFESKSEAKAVADKLKKQTGTSGYVAPYPFKS